MMVTRLPAVPLTFQLVTVCVVAAVKVKAVGWTPLAMAVKVLLPETVNAPAPSLDKVQLNVEPPPTKVLAVAPVMLILPVPVPAVVVKPVGAALLKDVVFYTGQTNVPPLNVMFFVPVAVRYRVPTVSVLPLRSMVPLVCVRMRVVPISRASASCTVPPTPLNVKGSSTVIAFDVTTCVPEVAPKVKIPEDAAKVIPVESVKFP